MAELSSVPSAGAMLRSFPQSDLHSPTPAFTLRRILHSCRAISTWGGEGWVLKPMVVALRAVGVARLGRKDAADRPPFGICEVNNRR